MRKKTKVKSRMTSLLKICLQMTLNKKRARVILGVDDEDDEDDDGSRKLVKYTESTKSTEDISEILAKNNFFWILEEQQCW